MWIFLLPTESGRKRTCTLKAEDEIKKAWEAMMQSRIMFPYWALLFMTSVTLAVTFFPFAPALTSFSWAFYSISTLVYYV